MEALDYLGKIRRGIIGGLDYSDKYYRQDCNSGEEQNKSCQHSKNRVKRFGNFHLAPSFLLLASILMAASVSPPNSFALLNT